jgi:SET domain
MAESTIPGGGMGMYVGHTAFGKGEVVIDSDLVVPWFEIQWHNGKKGFPSLWRNYAWNPFILHGLDQEVEILDDVAICSPGMGPVVNSKWNMVNLEDVDDTPKLGMSGVSSESPGAGAFTPYYGRQFRAITAVAPGMELFFDYGDGYFDHREDYDTMPREEDYVLADQLLELFQFLHQIVPALAKPHNFISEDLYQLMVHDHPFMMARTMHALPSNTTMIDHILMTGGTSNATFNETIRTLQWLEENGSCMDNIKDGVSTIPHAGRGAFANRFIPKGGLVAPTPLIHMGDRDVLTMYRPKPQKQGKRHAIRDLDQPTHQQLMLNYCFGHKDTTLLLCPYGSLTALINHSHDRPNVRIQWSKHMRHPEWLNQSVLEWHDTMHTGLSFDVVALRDIQEDEEILIDYGFEWETAWQEHVASFDVPRRGYMPAFEMNAHIDLQIKTVFEADYESIDGIMTYCRKHMVDLILGEEDSVVDLVDHDDNEEEEEEEDKDDSDLDDKKFYRCRVSHRNHNDSYVVEVLFRDTKEHPSGMWKVAIDVVEYVLFDAPRDTFYFRDAAYARDHHQEWAFRHDMRIPDEVLPSTWRQDTNQSRDSSFQQEF